MRNLKKNEQTIYYANFVKDEPIYALDDEGNILTIEDGDERVPVIDSYEDSYTEPIRERANISFNSGDTNMAEYGLDTTSYNAIITATKGRLPFSEQTLIWFESEPRFDANNNVIPESADYKVTAVKTSLNEQRFILKKRVDDGWEE